MSTKEVEEQGIKGNKMFSREVNSIRNGKRERLQLIKRQERETGWRGVEKAHDKGSQSKKQEGLVELV